MVNYHINIIYLVMMLFIILSYYIFF